MRNRRLSAANRRRDPLGAGLYLFRCAARFPPCIAPFALTIYGPICSGRRWIDLADPAESSALANGYAALLRAFPAACYSRNVGDRGIMPLDQLAATVRSVAETWSRGHQAADAIVSTATGTERQAAGRGRPRKGLPLTAAAARPSHESRDQRTTVQPLPLPPILPSPPIHGPSGLAEPDRRQSGRNGDWLGAALARGASGPNAGSGSTCEPGAGAAGSEAPDGGGAGWDDGGGSGADAARNWDDADSDLLVLEGADLGWADARQDSTQGRGEGL